MANTINFEAPQANLENGEGGVQLSPVVLPYSILNSNDGSQYLGGQMTLTADDGIKFSDNTHDWEVLALAKIKAMVADTEIYAPAQIVDAPDEPTEDPATEAPVASLDSNQVTTSTEV